MAQTESLTVEIKADTSQWDRQMADVMWDLFLLWEREAANRGSGLTKEQMTGARVYHEWVHRTDQSDA